MTTELIGTSSSAAVRMVTRIWLRGAWSVYD